MELSTQLFIGDSDLEEQQRTRSKVFSKYLIVGSGRVATHFQHYFQQLNIPFLSWSRRSSMSLKELAEQSSHVLLLISDREIDLFIKNNPFLLDKMLIHFSGSLTSKFAIGAHPLMTFIEELYPVSVYTEIPFIFDRSQLAFSDILPQLPNPSFAIAVEDRPYYHSLCVLSGNFTVILWSKLFSELEAKFKIPHHMAFPYLRQICQNLQSSEKIPLTGPLARGDWETVDKNLKSLENDPFLSVYNGFIKTFKEVSP